MKIYSLAVITSLKLIYKSNMCKWLISHLLQSGGRGNISHYLFNGKEPFKGGLN